MPKKLSDLIRTLDIREVHGPTDIPISELCYDSRSVTPGAAFFARPGDYADGHDFIEQALSRGAAAVFHTRPFSASPAQATVVRVHDVKQALSRVSSEFYDNPSRSMFIAGVTGTNGKTTTAYFLYQMLTALGEATGLLSSVYWDSTGDLVNNPLRYSTPEAPEAHRLLSEMLHAGKTAVVLEATSHALSDRTMRLHDVSFDAGVLTNISHEHLEFHGTMERYSADKANLFRFLDNRAGRASFGVVNDEDAYALYFRQASTAPVHGYSIAKQADLYAADLVADAEGTTFSLCRRSGSAAPTRIPIPGPFNVENALAAALVVLERDRNIPLRDVARLLPNISPVRGRLSLVSRGQPFTVIVDFAHSPDSFERLLSMLRGFARSRIISVFGSAGERDVAKRPMQGEIACRFSDIVIITEEDPRGEDRHRIMEDIAEGCECLRRNSDLFLIPDRRSAITRAFTMARKNDIVLLLGKGHESSIIRSDGPHPWDEIRAAEECLGALGYQ